MYPHGGSSYLERVNNTKTYFPYKSAYDLRFFGRQTKLKFVNIEMCSGIVTFNNYVFMYDTAIYYRHVFFEIWPFTNTFHG